MLDRFTCFLRKIMKISLKTKLNISFLAVITICGLIAALVGTQLIVAGIINQAQDNVRNDLNSAREIYQQEIKKVKDVVCFTALRFFIKDAILSNDIETLKKELDQIRKVESLDILTLTDKNGLVIARSRNPLFSGDSQAHNQLVNQVLSGKKAIAGAVILPKKELVKEGDDLVQQAHIKIISTPKAKPDQKTEQTSAMCMKAASAILGYDGSLIGILYGGNLLNQNYEIVDKVKEIAYQKVKYKGKDIGTATVFQGDLRISSNVKQADGSRAIGTRVSEEVYEQVLEKGLPWIDRAFVVNNWYIAAYEPIKDINEKIIGMLYVGVLEEKFMDMRNKAIAIFLGIMVTGMVMALVISSFLARGIIQPIKDLIYASGQWAKGNLDYRVTTKYKDEIGQLGQTFNHMALSLKERDEKLKEYADQQIMKSERLATLGQLSAGVAHEINNPLGAILMYTHLALEDLDDKDTMRRNLERAIAETSRCKDVVKGLFDFAHQTEPKVEQADINETVKRTLAIVVNQAIFKDVKITKKLCPSLPKVLMDVGQIQQVFTNIVLNAADAIEGTGELTVTTGKVSDDKYIQIEFTDTGCGIEQENLEKIFEPFFTTKEVGRGTGLGLAVSYGIITRHKGTIEVKSEPGKGTAFIIRLPVKQRED